MLNRLIVKTNKTPAVNISLQLYIYVYEAKLLYIQMHCHVSSYQ